MCSALDIFLTHFISMGSAVFVHRRKLSRTNLRIGPDVVSHETQTHNIPDILVKVKQLETDLSVALLGAEDEKKKAEQAAAVARETAIKADRDRAADIEAAIKAAEAKMKQLETDVSVALSDAEDEKKKAGQAAAVAREAAIKADRDHAADIEAAIKAAEAAWAATDDTKCEFE